MRKKLRLALFISGGGTTATAIISACFAGKLVINPVLVIASKKDIAGITRVQEAGLDKGKIVVIDPKTCQNENDFANKLLKECRKKDADLVSQYGWLPLTPKKFIEEYKGRIINQHPGPLDPPRADFGGKGMYGRRVQCAVLYFRRVTKHDYWTEATAHFITEEFDRGDVIKRRRIEILPSDTVEELQARIRPIEHEVQIETLNNFVKSTVKIYHRTKPLVKKDELPILGKAKEIAAILYPHG